MMKIDCVRFNDNPVVVNDMIYVRIKDGPNYYLNAYNMTTSDLVWSHKVNEFYNRVTILCPYDGKCYQLDAFTGAVVKPEWIVSASRAEILVGTLGKYRVMYTYAY